MRVTMATSPGTPGWDNEDFVAAVPGAVVLLDGAGIRGAEAICRHGTAWYTHQLGGALIGRLSRRDGRPLTDLLAESIEEITDAHRDTCDVQDPSSPQATVALFRIDGERADYLVLSDSFVVIGRPGRHEVITDPREVDVRSTVLHLPRPEAIKVFRAARNQPGGYYIAKDDPAVATQAVNGSRALGEFDAVALLSNGVANRESDWPGMLELLNQAGPTEVIRRFQTDDDATAAYCTELSAG
jgi:hypothetical protein